MREETGYRGEPVSRFLTLIEYYEEYRYISHYFRCNAVGRAEQALTDAERARGLVPAWVPVEEMLALFGRHAEYAETDEEKRGAYLREYTALSEYCKLPAGQ